MKQLKLYRGISVAESISDEVVSEIKTNGIILNEKQSWGAFVWKNIKPDIDIYRQKLDLSQDDTRPKSIRVNGYTNEFTEGIESVCFADKLGAEYYATKHNNSKQKPISILITTELNIEDIAIDGRDFLYTVFQNINPKDLVKTQKQTELLKQMFGNKIEVYIEKIIKHSNSDRLSICDLVVCDNEIIWEHSKNELIIGGRHNTIFKSAFLGKVPVKPENIIEVEIIKNTIFIPSPNIILNQILN